MRASLREFAGGDEPDSASGTSDDHGAAGEALKLCCGPFGHDSTSPLYCRPIKDSVIH